MTRLNTDLLSYIERKRGSESRPSDKPSSKRRQTETSAYRRSGARAGGTYEKVGGFFK